MNYETGYCNFASSIEFRREYFATEVVNPLSTRCFTNDDDDRNDDGDTAAAHNDDDDDDDNGGDNDDDIDHATDDSDCG